MIDHYFHATEIYNYLISIIIYYMDLKFIIRWKPSKAIKFQIKKMDGAELIMKQK